MASRTPGPFGTLLRRHRTAALLTREQLAVRAHLSADTIRALESGKRRTPRADTLHLLVEALALTGAKREAFLAAAAPPETASLAGGQITPPPHGALGAAQPNTLLGRESELEAISRRLIGDSRGDVEHARLLTLTGPAGVGKTRIALAAAAQMASHFPDGCVLIDLSLIRDSLLVLPTIAHAFGFVGVGNRPLSERLMDYLHEHSLLLVLDNFEQVLPAARLLADLLGACPSLAFLVTSRVPLGLRWEWTLRIAPLPVPDLKAPLPSLDALMEMPAVALFVARARARRADFALTPARAPLVARVVSELDGLPLAIELAASRLDALSLSTLTLRLGNRLRLLRWEAPDAPERQQSLEAAIGWSYDLLSVAEQRLFRCLGVFAGRVAVDALAEVASAMPAVTAGEHATVATKAWAAGAGAWDHERCLDGLTSLAEKSLVLPERQAQRPGFEVEADGMSEAREHEDAEPAFAMLETVREYAWEQLTAEGELAIARRSHAHFFLELAERADPELRDRDQLIWYRRLEQERGNLRAALRWLLDQGGPDAASQREREAALRLASGLAWYWWTRGYIVEGWRWLEEALRRAPQAEPALRVRALLGAGVVLAYQGARDRAETLLKEALVLAHEQRRPDEIARASMYLGLCALYAGNVAASVPSLREALRRGRKLDDPHLLGLTLLFLGSAAFAQGHDERAAAHYQESLTCFEMAGDALWAANLHVNLGWFASRRGDLPTAVGHIRIGLGVSVDFEDRRLLGVGSQMVLALSDDARMRTDLAKRVRLLGAIDALSQTTGMTVLQTLLTSSMGELRAQIQAAGLEATYREGRSLPFRAIATLALTLLESIPQMLPHSGRRPLETSLPRSTPSRC